MSNDFCEFVWQILDDIKRRCYNISKNFKRGGEIMEEIKEILVGMQGQINGLQGQFNGMQNQMNNMQNSIENIQQGQEEIKQEQSNMKKEMKHKDERLTQEVRAVNQRLAVFQEDITPKINVLFDADKTKQEHLDIHDSEICEIRKKQSAYDFKVLTLNDSNKR